MAVVYCYEDDSDGDVIQPKVEGDLRKSVNSTWLNNTKPNDDPLSFLPT